MHGNIIRKNLTLAETIAHRNPEIANELLMKNGYPHSEDRDILAQQLNNFLLNHRENALKQLAGIHPDKEIIAANFVGESDHNADGEGEGESSSIPAKRRTNKRFGKHHSADGDGYSNCCGHADGAYSNCAGCGGSCSHHSADGGGGSNKQAAIQTAALVNKEMLAIVGIISLAVVALIAISRPNKA